MGFKNVISGGKKEILNQISEQEAKYKARVVNILFTE